MIRLRLSEAETLIVQESIDIQNEIGEVTNTDWVDVRTIKGERQPLKIKSSRDLQGITETSTDRLFTKDIIKSNQRLITTDGITYRIQSVQDWRTHFEAILEKINVNQ